MRQLARPRINQPDDLVEPEAEVAALDQADGFEQPTPGVLANLPRRVAEDLRSAARLEQSRHAIEGRFHRRGIAKNGPSATPGYIGDVKKRERMTEAEQNAWEAEMRAAGITIVNPKPGTATITLLKKRVSTEAAE